jgi:hypothetical protein
LCSTLVHRLGLFREKFMSEASSTPAKGSTNKAEPRSRRISNPRPKKLAKATVDHLPHGHFFFGDAHAC